MPSSATPIDAAAADASAIHAKAVQLSKLAVRMTAKAGSGHPSSALSLAHVTVALLYRHMRHDPADPWNRASDRLVLSEGHAVPIVYAAWADLHGAVGRGADGHGDATRLRPDDVDGLRALDSVLDGHPNPAEGFPFFDAATGSLGQGLSVAAGLALGARLDGSPRRVFAIVGDGESREGQVWEALDFIVDHKLLQVCTIFNCNGQGQAGLVSPQQSPERLAEKLEAFGWSVRTIDGHDPDAIAAALAWAAGASDKPPAIVARTVKGWGVESMQKGNWHGKPPGSAELAAATDSLDATGKRVGAVARDLGRPPAPPTPTASPRPRPDPREAAWPSFPEAMRSGGQGAALEKGRLATRRAYGAALKAAGDLLPQVVCLDGDVSNSTFTEIFARAHPERFFECKIAEQNMVSVAAGLSAAGKIPFCSTFAKFVTRAYDQVEMAINSGANLKIVGSHAGITLAADGPSQMALPDVAWFRSWTTMKDHRGNPGCYILQPSDAYSAFALTQAMAEYEGACYMRTLRADTEFLYGDDQVFNLGGFEVLSEGRDVLLCAAGYMVHEANKALDALDKAGISATLVDLYSIPFDADALLDLAGANGGYVVTVEDNYGGGIGSAVADALTNSGDAFTLEQMFVRRIPKSARTEAEVLAMCGLTAQDIVQRTMKLLQVA